MRMQNLLNAKCRAGELSPRPPWLDRFRHIYREYNEAADEAAKKSLQWKRDFHVDDCAAARARQIPVKYLRIFTDGSHCDGIAAAGFAVFGAWGADDADASSVPGHWSNLCGTLSDSDLDCMVEPRWHL